MYITYKTWQIRIRTEVYKLILFFSQLFEYADFTSIFFKFSSPYIFHLQNLSLTFIKTNITDVNP